MDQQGKGENLDGASKKNVYRHHSSDQSDLQSGCGICSSVSLFYIDIDL